MQTLSERDILNRIYRRETFEGCLSGSFQIKVQDYVPFVVTAIHAGHNFRAELVEKCMLSEEERRYEEDPLTDEFANPFPITLIALDSRYEYDLNREPSRSIYDTAWGKQVWKEPLTQIEKQTGIDRHATYYRVLKALLTAINKIYGSSLLLDLHSYNYLRDDSGQGPVFNIGTWQMNLDRWNNTVDALEKRLGKIELPNVEMSVARNSAFEGRGYQTAFCRKHVRNTLAIPLEIAKIYMDENSGVAYPLVVDALRDQLYDVCLDIVGYFAKREKIRLKRRDLVSSELEPQVIKLDQKLFAMAKNLETLSYVNPINLAGEKRRFLRSRGRYEPQFLYRQLRIDPYEYREKLYGLAVSSIQDPMVHHLYRGMVDSFANKIELLAELGTEQFLYSSLRYYGQPEPADIANAKFLLHSPEIDLDPELLEPVPVRDALPIFNQAVVDRGLDIKTVISKKIVAKAMVDGTKRQLILNDSATYSRLEVQALIHHEIEVHLYTTFNAQAQPLKLLTLGLPGNTHTQEGLAIYNEYCSGHLNVGRLKILALRVLAVDMLVKGHSFRHIYQSLCEEYHQDEETAFSITMRVTRGGGFTKDYVYLRGLKDVLACAKTNSLVPLFMGKTSLAYRHILADLMERNILVAPRHLPELSKPLPSHPVLDYLLRALH